MNNKFDVAYIVSHGFAARMVLQTDLLVKLKQAGLKVALITPDKADQNLVENVAKSGIEIIEYKPSSTLWNSEYIRLRKYLFEDIKKNAALWEKHQHDLNIAKLRSSFLPLFKIRIFYLIYLVFNHFPLLRKLIAGLEKKSLHDPVANAIIKNLDSRLVISTYPVNLMESRLLYAANKYAATKTIIHLLSWDNITCKGYFPQLADYYISWGDIMKKEFIEFYKIPEEKIFNTGVPHFDLHFQAKGSLVYKQLLLQKGLNPGLPYLFFAMSSPYFSPNEIDIVEWLAQKIDQNYFGKIQMIVRPHPQNVTGYMADKSWIGRLKNLESDNVAVDWPKMVESNLNWSMQLNDMNDFAELLEGCAISINSGSTVCIDSLLHQKPVIMTLFDADEKLPWWHSIKRVGEYRHLKNLIDSKGIMVSNNYEELSENITRLLNDPLLHLVERENITMRECYKNDGQATERVVSAIQTIMDAG